MSEICRICQFKLNEIIHFGKMPLANAFLTQEQFDHEYFFDLILCICPRCGMLQLQYQPDPKEMFHDHYAFFSSTSHKMSEHFLHFANDIKNTYLCHKKDSFIVEIGSNDGIFLKNFLHTSIKHLGIEPSLNVAKVAQENGIHTLSDFFSKNLSTQIIAKYGKADVITAANVMCHIPNITSVVQGVIELLHPDGVFIFEDPYVGDILEINSFDQIYDEHVFYFSVTSLQNLFQQFGLEIIKVEPQKVHGGSLRYTVAFQNTHHIDTSVHYYQRKENSQRISDPHIWKQFQKNVHEIRDNFITTLNDLKKQKKSVVGYGATSKSTTVLNFCNIQSDLISYICDTTPIKQFKYSPGTHIPILPYSEFQKNKPDYTVLFAWNHFDEIMQKEIDYTNSRGKWIIFFPQVKVL